MYSIGVLICTEEALHPLSSLNRDIILSIDNGDTFSLYTFEAKTEDPLDYNLRKSMQICEYLRS